MFSGASGYLYKIMFGGILWYFKSKYVIGRV